MSLFIKSTPALLSLIEGQSIGLKFEDLDTLAADAPEGSLLKGISRHLWTAVYDFSSAEADLVKIAGYIKAQIENQLTDLAEARFPYNTHHTLGQAQDYQAAAVKMEQAATAAVTFGQIRLALIAEGK